MAVGFIGVYDSKQSNAFVLTSDKNLLLLQCALLPDSEYKHPVTQQKTAGYFVYFKSE